MKLEIGKEYRTRGGQKAYIVRRNGGLFWGKTAAVEKDLIAWTSDGLWYDGIPGCDSKLDLISLWEEESIEELHQKFKDWVKTVEWTPKAAPLGQPADQMTLLDQFALSIINGMLSSPANFTADNGEIITDREQFVSLAYSWARAMMAEKYKPEQKGE